MRTRLAIVVAVVAFASALTGCGNAAVPVAPRVSTGSSETTAAAPDHYTATRSSAGLALGLELQRTKDARLAGKIWAMSVTGKADLAGTQPALTLWAITTDGKRTVIRPVNADGTSGVSSVQDTFVVQLPPNTARIAAYTSLRAQGATEAAPAFTVPLGDITEVAAPTLAR